jgi:hypothetical protein
LRYAQLELEKTRQENARLRKALKERSREAKRINRAYEDALLLATWRSGGIIPSRRFAMFHGISQHRFENSVALLKMARVIQRQRHWVTQDLAVIESRLSTARDKALTDPALFFLRLNKHHRRLEQA